MRLIVTGSCGFIGSIMTRRASEMGHAVVALDDLSRGLNVVEGLPGVSFLKHDCQGGFEEALRQALDAAGWDWRTPPGLDVRGQVPTVDAVVHLAAGTGSLDRPIEELRALNVGMTQRVYMDAWSLGAKAFAFPTTSLALTVPDSPYVQSKEEAMAWLLAQDQAAPRRDGAGERLRPRLVPLRFFNVTGAYKGLTERRRLEVHIIPTLVDCYREGRPFVVNGADWETPDGTPGRDFVNVLDVVDYVLRLVERVVHRSLDPGPRASDGAIWVGTGRVTSVLDVVRIFQQWIGGVQVEFGPRRAFDCGDLRCAAEPAAALARWRMPAPAWVGIRDEALALLGDRHGRYPEPRVEEPAAPQGERISDGVV